MTQPNFDRFSPLPISSAREERVNDENGELRERIEELEGRLEEAEGLLEAADYYVGISGTAAAAKLLLSIQQFLKPEGER